MSELNTAEQYYNEPRHNKNLFMPNANNNSAYKPTHPRSLNSVFIIRCLDSIVPIGDL